MRKVFVFTIAVVLSLIFTLLSASVSVAAVSKSNHKLPESTKKMNEFAKSFEYSVKGKTSYGYDWSYYVTAKNVKVTCKYDFKKKNYKFKLTGKKYGLTKVILRYRKTDKKWGKKTLRVFVDPDKNIMRTKKIKKTWRNECHVFLLSAHRIITG